MNKPTDTVLYNKVKNRIIKANPKNSAYRSGLIVKDYKDALKKKSPNKKPYTGTKTKEGLSRWYREDWRNQRGGIGYSSKGDIYRPTKKISDKTPSTFSQLNKIRIKKAMEEKRRTGRVKKY